MSEKNKSLNYSELGASATKAGLHEVLNKVGLKSSADVPTDTFASLVPDFAADPEYLSFLHADGAGTKAIVAYLLFKETGDPRYFRGLAQDSLVMNLDDVFCLGPVESLVLSNAIARNAKLIGDEVLREVILGYKELVEQLETSGISIRLAGGETADCGDLVRTILVDSTLAGRVKRKSLIQTSRIQAGDMILGFSSAGQASYESSENSGIASNGLTLARHSLLKNNYIKLFPEVALENPDLNLLYQGPFSVLDKVDSLTKPSQTLIVGELLLSPTRTYAPVLNEIYRELGTEVHAAIHCTGGGQTKVLRFGQGLRYIKDELFPTPQVFKLIQQYGNVSWREMYQVFNMGHRLELYLGENRIQIAREIAEKYKIEVKVVGRVEAAKDATNSLLLRSAEGEFSYQL